MSKIINKIKTYYKNHIKKIPSNFEKLIILFTPFVLLSLKNFVLDNDFWFIITTGREILKNGFVTIEPFTIHEGLFFIPQQWLSAVIFYLIYNKFDMLGMFVLINIVNVIIIILLYKLSVLISNNKYRLSLVITVIIDMMLIASFITTRPQIFDIVLILAEIYIMELYIRKEKIKYLLFLPIISLLMINLHASVWPMLFIILFPYYLGRINTKYTTKERYKLRPIIIVNIIMILFGFINPYGLDAMLYFFKSYGFSEINYGINEMISANIKNNLNIYICFFIILFLYYVNKNRGINLRYILLFLGTTYLGFLHLRGLMFFYIGSLLVLVDNLKYIVKDDSTIKMIIDKKGKCIINVLFAVIMVIMLVMYIRGINFDKAEEKAKIADYLDENATKNIKLYTEYDHGGYLEYRGYKCYIDARAELFYKKNNKKEDIMIEYFYLKNNKMNPQTFLNKYNFDYLLVTKSDPLYYYLENIDYEMVLEVKSKNNAYVTYRLYKNNKKVNI